MRPHTGVSTAGHRHAVTLWWVIFNAPENCVTNPYCSDPDLQIEGGDNLCRDIQAAVYGANESGRDVIFKTSGGKNVRWAFAELIREGDKVTAVFNTRIK